MVDEKTEPKARTSETRTDTFGAVDAATMIAAGVTVIVQGPQAIANVKAAAKAVGGASEAAVAKVAAKLPSIDVTPLVKGGRPRRK